MRIHTSNSHFQRGSGAFKCDCCGRLTRKTSETSGHDGRLCPQDYQLAGIYNVHQDGGDLTLYRQTILTCTSEIIEKGGTLDSDARELLAWAQLDPTSPSQLLKQAVSRARLSGIGNPEDFKLDEDIRRVSFPMSGLYTLGELQMITSDVSSVQAEYNKLRCLNNLPIAE